MLVLFLALVAWAEPEEFRDKQPRLLPRGLSTKKILWQSMVAVRHQPGLVVQAPTVLQGSTTAQGSARSRVIRQSHLTGAVSAMPHRTLKLLHLQRSLRPGRIQFLKPRCMWGGKGRRLCG